MAAATAQIGVAEADWWPRFSLTGTAGFDSSELKHLGDWDSHYYSIAPGISWPILDWGRIKANIRIENTRQQQAFLVYRNTVSSALRDVEDALVNYEQEQARRASLAGAVDANRRARQLARESYDHGVTDTLPTLDAERGLLQSEDALAQSDGAMRRDLIALYKALGGGWE
jgi:outer membrane protein TolC